MPSGTLAYTDRPGIYRVETDGSGVQLLVPDQAFFPRWSPDGSLLAFRTVTLRADFTSWLDVVRADGTGRRHLGAFRYVGEPAESDGHGPEWAPDGSAVLFDGRRRETDGTVSADFDIFVVSAVTGDPPAVLVAGAQSDAYAVWSPDGKQIAFLRNENGGDDLHVARSDGSAIRRVTFSAGQKTSPVWLREERIAYVKEVSTRVALVPGEVREVIEVDLAAGTSRVLATFELPVSGLVRSRDGSCVAFGGTLGVPTRTTPSDYRTYVYCVDEAGGSVPIEIARGLPLTFSADGRHLVVHRTAQRGVNEQEAWIVGIGTRYEEKLPIQLSPGFSQIRWR